MNTDDKDLLEFWKVLTIQMAAKRPRNASSKIVRTVLIPYVPIVSTTHYIAKSRENILQTEVSH